eukprot:354857-Chlamydomonas_euryale.AAC.48
MLKTSSQAWLQRPRQITPPCVQRARAQTVHTCTCWTSSGCCDGAHRHSTDGERPHIARHGMRSAAYLCLSRNAIRHDCLCAVAVVHIKVEESNAAYARMSVHVHCIGTGNGDVGQQAEAVAAVRVVGVGDSAAWASMVAGWSDLRMQAD